MVAALDHLQTKPSPTLIKQLERIGEIREYLGRSEYRACGALGLQVQLSDYDIEASVSSNTGKGRRFRKNDFRRLKAVVGSNVCLDAFAKSGRSEDWTVLVYEAGRWEVLCQPTLRLCQWLQDWGGLHPEMQLTLQVAVERFKETGQFTVPLRQETGGRLCGRCGDEVKDLAAHIHDLHDRPNALLPLATYLRIRTGKKSIMVVQGKGHNQHMWTVPEEFHRPDLNDPKFQLGVAHDIDRIFSLTGKSRMPAIIGKYPLPQDITPLPYLANVLRGLTRGGGSGVFS